MESIQDGRHSPFPGWPGEQGEYMRKGLSWKRVTRLVEQLKADLPQGIIRVYCTVSAFNGFHLPEFIEFLLDSGWILPARVLYQLPAHPSVSQHSNLPRRNEKIAQKKVCPLSAKNDDEMRFLPNFTDNPDS